MTDHTVPRTWRRPVSVIIATAMMAIVLGLAVNAEAVPGQGRELAGYGNMLINGHGSLDSWEGSYTLWTGAGNTGTNIHGFCVQTGIPYPTGTSSFTAGFTDVTATNNIPALRGVSLIDQAALSVALFKHQDSLDPVVAAATYLVVKELSADSNFWINGGGPGVIAPPIIENATFAGNWAPPLPAPAPASAPVAAMAIAIRDDARAKYGPWNISAPAVVYQGSGLGFNITATMTGGGGQPLPGETIRLNITNGTGGPVNLTTDAAGQVTFVSNITNPALPLSVQASIFAPLPYRIFAGQAGTQHVITGGLGIKIANGEAPMPNQQAQVIKATSNPGYQTGEGAVFDVQTAPGGVSVGTLTVTASGQSNLLIGLIPGNYQLVETAAPEGQVLNPTPILFTAAGGGTITVNAVNAVTATGSITVNKTDPGGAPLAGAVFVVMRDSNNDGTYDLAAVPGPDGMYATADDGQVTAPVTVTGLQAGNYQITEITPPPGGYTLPAVGVRTQTATLTWGSPATPADNVIAVTVAFVDGKPTITTQASDPGGGAAPTPPFGQATTDTVVIGGVAADVTGVATVSMYGPFVSTIPASIAAAGCTAANLISSATVPTVGSGAFVSSVFAAQNPGIYTYVTSWAGSDGSSATHPCGTATETFTVQSPAVATQTVAAAGGAASNTFNWAAGFADQVTITGVASATTGTVVTSLYGPFVTANPTAIAAAGCSAANLISSSTLPVTGSGTFTSPVFAAPAPGNYTFVSTWDNGAGVIGTNACGDGTELISMSTPSVTTNAIDTAGTQIGWPTGQSAFGTVVADQVTVINVAAGSAGAATTSMYGPFANLAPAVCDATTLVSSSAFTTTGSGTFTSPTFVVASPGFYTFITSVDHGGGVVSGNACGDPAESFSIASPAAVTQVAESGTGLASNAFLYGAPFVDQVTVTGVVAGLAGTITTSLYGPITGAVTATSCVMSAVQATQMFPTSGSGTFTSPDFVVNAPGTYTFVSTWDNGAGVVAANMCGTASETVTIDTQVITTIAVDPLTTQPLDLIATNQSIADQITVVGVAPTMTGTITTVVFGPYPTGTSPTCVAANAMSTSTITTTGSGVFTSAPFTVASPGIYAFVSTWRGSDGSVTSHPCGQRSEMFGVPGISTDLSVDGVTAAVSIADATAGVSLIGDVGHVRGVFSDTPGAVTFVLYGPFNDLASISCVASSVVSTQIVAGVGGGDVASTAAAVPSTGFYTFVATWQQTGTNSPITATHRCGEIAEMVLVHPAISTTAGVAVDPSGAAVMSDSVDLVGLPATSTGVVRFDLYGPYQDVALATCDQASLISSDKVATSGSGPFRSPDTKLTTPGTYSFIASWYDDAGLLQAGHRCALAAETLAVTVSSGGAGTGGLAITGTSLTIPFVAAGAAAVVVGFLLVWFGFGLERRRQLV